MRATIIRTRMATNGRDYAYDVLVPVADVPHIKPHWVTTICRGAGRYYRFEDATTPLAHWSMEKGWDRYEQRLAHDKAMEAVMLELTKSVFPELATAEKWPTLWVSIPTFEGTHAEVTIPSV